MQFVWNLVGPCGPWVANVEPARSIMAVTLIRECVMEYLVTRTNASQTFDIYLLVWVWSKYCSNESTSVWWMMKKCHNCERMMFHRYYLLGTGYPRYIWRWFVDHSFNSTKMEMAHSGAWVSTQTWGLQISKLIYVLGAWDQNLDQHLAVRESCHGIPQKENITYHTPISTLSLYWCDIKPWKSS